MKTFFQVLKNSFRMGCKVVLFFITQNTLLQKRKENEVWSSKVDKKYKWNKKTFSYGTIFTVDIPVKET